MPESKCVKLVGTCSHFCTDYMEQKPLVGWDYSIYITQSTELSRYLCTIEQAPV